MSKKTIHFKVIQKSRIDALEDQALADKGRSITGGNKCPSLTIDCPTDLPCADLICADFEPCTSLTICATFFKPCGTLLCRTVMCGDDPVQII